ncbi:MAG TPA: hypothetical protein VF875_06055 [Anaeromyxobacter sp.]
MTRARAYGDGHISMKRAAEVPYGLVSRDKAAFGGRAALLGGHFTRDTTIDQDMARALVGFPRFQNVRQHIDGKARVLGLADELAAAVCADDSFTIDSVRWVHYSGIAIDLLEGRTPPKVTVAVLDGLIVDAELRLAANLVIRPMRPYDRAVFAVNDVVPPYLAATRRASGIELIDSGTADVHKHIVSAVVQALRTWCAGPVSWLAIHTGPQLDRGGDMILREVAPRTPCPPHCLDDPAGFATMWREAHDSFVNPDGRFAVALTRLEVMCDLPRPHDHVLDQMIILEGLLLEDAPQSEIGYRLTQRAALFLRDDAKSRREVRETVKQVYGLRSKIAHGKKLKPAYSAAIAEAHGLTRELMRKYAALLARRRQAGLTLNLSDELDNAIMSAPVR